jgi:endo-1,4-beta-xylanase
LAGVGSGVTSWDVVNEIVGDGVSNGMTAFQCVKNKNAWPTQTSDNSGSTLLSDLSFVYAAFNTAYKYAGSSTRLAINDYKYLNILILSQKGSWCICSTGGNDAKTACVLTVLKDVQSNTAIPWNRLAIGYQSHVSASPGGFATKSQLANTFSTLNALGAEAMITELDIKVSSTSSNDLR